MTRRPCPGCELFAFVAALALLAGVAFYITWALHRTFLSISSVG